MNARHDDRWIRLLWALELVTLFMTSVMLADDLRLIPIWTLTAMALLVVQTAAIRSADEESGHRPVERHREDEEML